MLPKNENEMHEAFTWVCKSFARRCCFVACWAGRSGQSSMTRREGHRVEYRRTVSASANALRWMLVVPSLGVGIGVAIFAAFISMDLLMRLCPADQVESGACMASWYGTATEISFALATALGAVLFVAVPSTVAPTRKFEVALLAFATGVCFVGYLNWPGMRFMPEAIAAVLGGGNACMHRWRARGVGRSGGCLPHR